MVPCRLLRSAGRLAVFYRKRQRPEHSGRANDGREREPAFDVATIRLSDLDAHSSGFRTRGHRISCANETLGSIVSFAYGLHAKQIVDAPAWFDSDRYDIEGFPDVDGVPSLKQQQEMFRKLLASRFQLVFHRDKHDLPIYAMTVAKGGPKLTKSAGEADGLPDATGNQRNSSMTMKFTNVSMADLVLNLNFYADRPVVDQTGLAGKYDFVLSWTLDDSRVSEPDAPPSLFTAAREQLGLKIEAVKGPAEVLVIDRVERPSQN